MRDGKDGPTIISYDATNPAPECPQDAPYTMKPTMSPTTTTTTTTTDDTLFSNGRCDEAFCMCTVTAPSSDELDGGRPMVCPDWMYSIGSGPGRYGTDSVDGNTSILVCTAYDDEGAFNQRPTIGQSAHAETLHAKVGDTYIVKYDETNPAPECPDGCSVDSIFSNSKSDNVPSW
jgi:hypothetical protein